MTDLEQIRALAAQGIGRLGVEWPEPTPPQVGDEIRLDAPPGEARLKVASAVRSGAWWTLRARPRGAAW